MGFHHCVRGRDGYVSTRWLQYMIKNFIMFFECPTLLWFTRLPDQENRTLASLERSLSALINIQTVNYSSASKFIPILQRCINYLIIDDTSPDCSALIQKFFFFTKNSIWFRIQVLIEMKYCEMSIKVCPWFAPGNRQARRKLLPQLSLRSTYQNGCYWSFLQLNAVLQLFPCDNLCQHYRQCRFTISAVTQRLLLQLLPVAVEFIKRLTASSLVHLINNSNVKTARNMTGWSRHRRDLIGSELQSYWRLNRSILVWQRAHEDLGEVSIECQVVKSALTWKVYQLAWDVNVRCFLLRMEYILRLRRYSLGFTKFNHFLVPTWSCKLRYNVSLVRDFALDRLCDSYVQFTNFSAYFRGYLVSDNFSVAGAEDSRLKV